MPKKNRSTYPDKMSVREFFFHLAKYLNRKPADLENFVEILMENWINDVATLKEIDDEQFKSLGFPIGLVS